MLLSNANTHSLSRMENFNERLWIASAALMKRHYVKEQQCLSAGVQQWDAWNEYTLSLWHALCASLLSLSFFSVHSPIFFTLCFHSLLSNPALSVSVRLQGCSPAMVLCHTSLLHRTEDGNSKNCKCTSWETWSLTPDFLDLDLSFYFIFIIDWIWTVYLIKRYSQYVLPAYFRS